MSGKKSAAKNAKTCDHCGAGTGGSCVSCGAPLGHAWLPERAIKRLEKEIDVLMKMLDETMDDHYGDGDESPYYAVGNVGHSSGYEEILDAVAKIGRILGGAGAPQ